VNLRRDILDLIDQYLEIVNSDQNKENKKYWQNNYIHHWNRDMWRGVPKVDNEAIPFTVALDNSLMSKVMKVDLREYYSDPETYLETQLRMKIYHWENFNDCTYFTDELFIWFGVITELSFFGAPIQFEPYKEAWISQNILDDYKKLNALESPDFYKSGLMPRIHQYYEVLNEYAQGKLKAMFPEWVRGPFCIATHLRETNNILMDLLLDPHNLHALMRLVVDWNKEWNRERSKFLGTEVKGCRLYNDEIAYPSLSPAMFREFVLPYEKELGEHYGGVNYWHSCGDTTAYIEDIAELPNLLMFHCGPWTSFEKADKVFGEKAYTTLDVDLNPVSDVIEADKETMVAKLKKIKDTCRTTPYAVRADAFMPDGPTDYIIKQIKVWIEAAREVLGTK